MRLACFTLTLFVAACTTAGRRSSKNNDATTTSDTQSDVTGADLDAAGSDTSGPGADVIDPPTPIDGCSPEHPDGACEGSDLCVDGACSTPEVRVTLVTVSNDGWAQGASPAYGGAGNGLADAGEVFDLAPTVANSGATNYLSVSGKLVSNDARATIVESNAVYDDLIAGGTKAPETPFKVRLEPGIANGTVLTLNLELMDSKEGAVATLPVRVGVRRGVSLGMANPFVDDDTVGKSQGDGDRLIEAGEEIELVLDLSNGGQVDVPIAAIPYDQVQSELQDQRVEVRMTSDSAYLTVLDLDNPPTFTATVAAGGSQSSAADFDFAVAAGASDGACLDFVVALQAAGRTLYRFTETRCFQFGGPLGEACVPKAEVCNGLDDDCDGKADNDCVSSCGDGVRDPWEACDDNNTKGGDGCSGDCLVAEGCGNGVVDPGETCDTTLAGSCPVKAECEAKSDCTTKWTHTGVACQQKCESSQAAGGTCNDNDPCTTGDACQDGKCVGKPLICTATPANSCTGKTLTYYAGENGTCVAGKCNYASTQKTCKYNCSSGFCSPSVSGGGVYPVLGTFRHFALAETSPGVAYAVYSGADDGIRIATVDASGATGTDEPISYEAGVGAFGVGAGAVNGAVEAAYATASGLLYVGQKSAGEYYDSWQSSTVPGNHRDLTAAWASDGTAHIFLRNVGSGGQLLHHTEGTTWSGTPVLTGVTDLGRAVALGSTAYAPVTTSAGLVIVSAGAEVTTETVPNSVGAGEPALAVDGSGRLYAVFRKGTDLMMAVRANNAWSNQPVTKLDGNAGGFAVGVNAKGTVCILVANSATKEMAFFLWSGGVGAAYLLDDTFQNVVQQEQYTQIVVGSDGRFYVGYLTADGDGLVVAVLVADD